MAKKYETALQAALREERGNHRAYMRCDIAEDEAGLEVLRSKIPGHQRRIATVPAENLNDIRLRFAWLTHPDGLPNYADLARRQIMADLKRFAAA